MSVEERKKERKEKQVVRKKSSYVAWPGLTTDHSCALLLAAGASCGGGVKVLKEEGDLPRL